MIARLTMKSLVAHKLRLGLTAIAVILGTAFVAGTLIYSDTTSKAFDDLFDQTGKGVDTVVRAKQSFDASSNAGDVASGPPMPASVLETVRRVDGVDRTLGTTNGEAQLFGKDGKKIGGNGPPTIGVSWSDDAELTSMHMTKGKPPATPGEIAIDSEVAGKKNFKPGDQIKVAVAGKGQTFTLSGIFRNGSSGYTGGATITAFEAKTAQSLLMEKPGTYDSIQIHAKDGVSQEQLRDRVTKALPSGTEAITGKKASDEDKEDIEGILKIFRISLLVFAIVAVFVGSFIIFNTFSMLVAQRSRELALLRAVGASRKQVTRSVLGEAIGVGLAGSTAGLLAGIGLAVGLRALLKGFGMDLPSTGLVVSASTVIWAYAVGMVVTMFAAYFPARRAAKTPPVAAMRDDTAMPARSLRVRVIVGAAVSAGGALSIAGGFAGSGSGGATLVGLGALLVFLGVAMLSPVLSKPVTRVLGWPLAKLAGPVGKLSRQNAQRNPRRTAATASALMIGLALVAMVSVLAASINASVDKQLKDGLGADYMVTSANFTPFDPSATSDIAKVPGVGSAAPVQDGQLKLEGDTTDVAAGDPKALTTPLKLTMKQGEASLGTDQLLINEKTSKDKGWTVGEKVAGQYPDGANATFSIAGVFDDNPIAPPIMLSTGSYKAHYPSDKVQIVFVNLADGANAAQVEKALEGTMTAWPSLELQDQQDIKDQVRSQVNMLLSLIIVMLVLSIIIAVLGIVNTLALSVVERTREIGLLRAVGMSRRQLRRMIRYESVVISVFGALLGLGIGIGFGTALQIALKDQGFTVLGIPYGQLAMFVVAAGLIGVFAAIWPARRAAKMDVLRAITVE